MQLKRTLLICALILIAAATAEVAAAVTMPDPVNFYSFDDDDTSGTTSVDRMGNMNGTLSGSPTTGISGMYNQAYSFDGTDDYMTINNWAGLDWGSGDYSVCYWLNIQRTNTGQIYWSRRTSNSPHSLYYGLTSPSNYAELLSYFSGNEDYIRDTTYFQDSYLWQHHCEMRDGSNLTLWINGTILVTEADSPGTLPASAHMIVGAEHYDGSPVRESQAYFDEVYVYNQSLTAEQVQELASGTYQYGAPADPDPTSINITITDDFNGTSINTFTIDITWNNGTTATHSTTNGSVYLNNVSYAAHTVNVTYYSMTDYFNHTLLNKAVAANTTTNIAETTYQAVVCFNATERISDAALTPDNITIGSTVRTSCFNITAGQHNAMAQKAGYDSKNQTFNITALTNTTQTIYNMSSNTLTVYAQDIISGVYLSNYELNVTSLNHTGWAGDYYASTTNQSFELINGTYTVSIDATGYALTDAEVNVSVTGDGSYTFQLYPTNFLNLTFFDEDNNAVLSGPNITFEIILDDANATIGTTTNGTYWIDGLDAGEYEIRYRASEDGYDERSYFFTLTNRTYNSLSLYLMNNSNTEDITVNLYDEYGNKLEGYTIILLRYYASESGFLTVDQGATNSEGQTVLTAIRNGPYYKFRIANGDGTILKTTASTQIYDTTTTLYVTLGEGIGESLENLNGVSYSLTWLNASNQFMYTWDNPDATVVSAELLVYTTDAANGDVLYNSTSLSTASGTVYVGVARVNGTTYKAMAYVTFSGDTEATLIDTLMQTFDDALSVFGRYGLFLTFIIVLVFAGLGIGIASSRGSPSAVVVLVPVAILLTRVAKLHALGWTWVAAIIAVAAIILYVIRDNL